MICPDCNGKMTMLGVFPIYVKGKTGPPAIEMDCFRCNGLGHVPDQMQHWIELGRKCEQVRHNDGRGPREAADFYGIKASELVSMEDGRRDPRRLAEMLGVLESQDT